MFIAVKTRKGEMILNINHIVSIRPEGKETIITLSNTNIIYAVNTYEQIIKALNEAMID